MGKRMTAALAVLMCLFALAACGSQQQDVYETSDVQAMVDAGAFSVALEEVDGDTAFQLCGLSSAGLNREDMTDCAVLCDMGLTCEIGAVFVFSTEEQAASAVTALEDYIQGQITENENYRPEEIPKLESALLDQRGNTVLMAVASDTQAAQGAVE